MRRRPRLANRPGRDYSGVRSPARPQLESGEELLGAPGVPPDWRELNLQKPPSLVLPFEIRLGECSARFFTTLTTLGAPQDVTLQELRIESFHPAATERMIRGAVKHHAFAP